jgi:murein DD-endopeptidase MepM/ murein hydrolase activator NlpD
MSNPRSFFFALAVVCAVLALPVGARAQEQGPVYVVEPGDTLWGLAAEFGTSVEALSAANGLSGGGLTPGQQLIIPGFEGLSGRLATHEVAFGEDLRTTAQSFGIDAEDLLRLNRGISPERLYIGQPLIVTIDEGNPLALPEASRLLPGTGATLSEVALKQGMNPWRLLELNGASDNMWLLPRDTLAIPAPGTSHVAFPKPVDAAQTLPAVGVQGHTLTLRILTQAPIEAYGTVGDWPLTFNAESSGSLAAVQGVHALAEPGIYDLSVSLRQPGEQSDWYTFDQPIRVRAGEYGRENLTVDPQTLDPDVTGPEDAQIQQVVAPNTPTKRWDGPFEFPSTHYTESFPSVFGTRRNYNGQGYFSYHNGLDFYGGTGVPILAAAPGQVVFAGPLTVRGNAVYIDHGWGVYSGYLHQSEILVEVGQMVEAGSRSAQSVAVEGSPGRTCIGNSGWGGFRSIQWTGWSSPTPRSIR